MLDGLDESVLVPLCLATCRLLGGKSYKEKNRQSSPTNERVQVLARMLERFAGTKSKLFSREKKRPLQEDADRTTN